MQKLSLITARSPRSSQMSKDVEIVGPKGAARFRMAPLDTQGVGDLFAEHDLLQSARWVA